ncbi:MAG: DUF4159 domain-containing protein [Candidatus Solibacter usitatus]|nr:DUF4159 domain-containing protein [Candidatus Solibacter usitatus]
MPGASFLLLLVAALAFAQFRFREAPPESKPFPAMPAKAEYHFLRMEYRDLSFSRRGFGPGRGWWRVDWPDADAHFTQGVQRLTRVDIGEPQHLPLLDNHIYDFPWIYATQAGYMDLSNAEAARLREYLLRGGFLVVDDFHGPDDWDAFRAWMQRVFPEQPILDLEQSDPLMHVVYDLDYRTQIPGLRHLRRGAGGATDVVMPYGPPLWRALKDAKGRMVVAINFNMDVGDAWEHADWPVYPEAMTSLAYRFGINYIVYAMTH